MRAGENSSYLNIPCCLSVLVLATNSLALTQSCAETFIKKRISWAREWPQWIGTLKSADLNFTPRTHTVEEENVLLQNCHPAPYTTAQKSTHTGTQDE